MLNGSLKIAIQKSGRISKQSQKLLSDIGLRFELYDRQLYSKCTNANVSILLVRDDDIPEFVETGVADIGIVGIDEVLESQSDVEVKRNLGFGKCKLSLAVKKDSEIRKLSDLNNKSIATSFPNIAKNFVTENKIDASIVEITGSVEIAPILGLSDAIVDLVSSGFTLKSNGLEVIDDILDVETVLITPKNLEKKREEQVEKLIGRIDSLNEGSKYKYLLMNVPESKLPELVKVNPGLKSPTISKLGTEGWVSVQTVVIEDQFWEIIDKLKELGATDILVTPIEKLIR